MFRKNKQYGMTLIELLLALGIAAILVVMAVPTVTHAFARSNVRAATENVVQALRLAKNTARAASTTVTVTFTANQGSNTITFAFPDGSNILAGSITLEPVQLPTRITLVADDNTTFQFDSMGMVDNLGALIVTSTLNTSFTRTITVVNSLGRVAIT